jgi:hypothetical protein
MSDKMRSFDYLKLAAAEGGFTAFLRSRRYLLLLMNSQRQF